MITIVAIINITFGRSLNTLFATMTATLALRAPCMNPMATIVPRSGQPISRFDSPRQLMAHLGLVPSEHSSGGTRKRGGITKTGNGQARRVLIEASWCYRVPARKTAHIQRKAQKASEAVQAIAWKAQKRLFKRYWHLANKGKLLVEACVAVARELAGFIWAIVREVMGKNKNSIMVKA